MGAQLSRRPTFEAYVDGSGNIACPNLGALALIALRISRYRGAGQNPILWIA